MQPHGLYSHINDSKKSFIADCAIALLQVIPESASREEFISGMEQRGWAVQWENKRKHITFRNENGDKVRDTNIENTFTGMEVNKEALTHEFERQNELRLIAERERKARRRARHYRLWLYYRKRWCALSQRILLASFAAVIVFGDIIHKIADINLVLLVIIIQILYLGLLIYLDDYFETQNRTYAWIQIQKK